MLLITVEGQAKFVIRDQYEQADRLMKANVEFLEMEQEVPLPEEHGHLANLLGTLIEHEALKDRKLDINFEEARDVGARLTELLPCPNRYKQRLLEMRDPIARLAEIEKLLERIQQAKEH
jgi:Lon protease-like protein